MIITTYWIKSKLREIRKAAKAGDYEVAHSKRDELYEKVLEAIADSDQPANASTTLAEEALKAKKIKFQEHCS